MKKILGICLVASFVFSEDLLAWGTAADQIVKRDNELRGKLTSTIDKLEQVNKDNVAANAANTALREKNAKLSTTVDGLSKGNVNIEALETLEQKESAVKGKFGEWENKICSFGRDMLSSIALEDPTQTDPGKYDQANNQNGYNVDEVLATKMGGDDVNSHEAFFDQLAALGNRGEVNNGANGDEGCVDGNKLAGYFRSIMEAYVVGNVVDAVNTKGFEEAAGVFYKQNDSLPVTNLDEDHVFYNTKYDMTHKVLLGNDFSNTMFVTGDGKAGTWTQHLESVSHKTQEETIDALINFLDTIIRSEGVQVISGTGAESLSYAYKVALCGQVLGLFAKDGIKCGNDSFVRPFLGKAADQDGGLYAYEKELTTAQRTKLVEILYRLLVSVINSYK